MKTEIERRKPEGIKDQLALAVTTFGVGYIPGAPGTYGSAVGVLIYIFSGAAWIYFSGRFPAFDGRSALSFQGWTVVFVSILLVILILAGIWAAERAIGLLGNSDPSQAVVDEVIGQLVTFLFIPFTFSWQMILAGFLLFRLFDIWKPYPIDDLQNLHGGLGICADDIVAGVYAGVCLSVIHALSLSL